MIFLYCSPALRDILPTSMARQPICAKSAVKHQTSKQILGNAVEHKTLLKTEQPRWYNPYPEKTPNNSKQLTSIHRSNAIQHKMLLHKAYNHRSYNSWQKMQCLTAIRDISDVTARFHWKDNLVSFWLLQQK